MRKWEGTGIRVLGALALVLSVSASALADVSDVVLTVLAVSSSTRDSGVLQITADQCTQEGDNYFWTAPQDIAIGTLGTIQAGSSIALFADPQIAMGFAFQAGDTDTDVTITSALLSFDPIVGEARADAAFTVMDYGFSGASLTGLEPGGGAYRAYYNGTTTFTEGINEIIAPPGLLAEDSFAYPGAGAYESIGTVSDMGAQISFRLSAHAFASGSSNFEIVPEPAGLLLLVLGLGLLRRR